MSGSDSSGGSPPHVRIERPEARFAVLIPSGALDGEQLQGEIGEAVGRLVGEGVTGVVVDLSAFDVLDSAGLGALVAGHREISGAPGGSVVLTGVAPRLRVILSRSMLLQVLPVYESVERALEALRR